MSVIKSANLLYKFVLIAIGSQCLSANTDLLSNNIEFSPIITVKEKEKQVKEPPAPGLSFGAPSAYGAGGGSVFVGISYGADGQEGLFTFTPKTMKKVAMNPMNIGLE